MFTAEHDFQDDVSEMTSNTFDDVAGELDDKDEKQQAAWKEKIVQKLVRNIEMSVRDLHVRCEVGERALNSGPEQKHTKNNEEESSFAFGFQFDALILKSANSSWNTGRNVDFKEQDTSQRKETISVAGKESVIHDTKYKVFMLKNMSMYWDDSPPIILSETPLLQNPDKCDAHKIWSTVRLALNNMKDYQDPGEEIRNMLMGKMETNNQKISKVSNSLSFDGDNELLIEHSYVISPTTIEVRMKLHNLGLPGRTHCQAELMPCKFNFNFNPKQMRQYRAIQYAMFAQQRLDTMLHQRPKKSPKKDPLDWWKYAISCVTTRPNARPWRDVKKIVRKRSRYIELVEMKHLRKDVGALSLEERAELLELEDLLPIETLLSFHLLALRNVVKLMSTTEKVKNSRRNEQNGEKRNTVDSSHHSVSPSISRRRRRSSSRPRNAKYSDENDTEPLTNNALSPPRGYSDVIDSNVVVDPTSLEQSYTRNTVGSSNPIKTPTKSPLPRKPGRGRKNSVNTSIASMDLDNIVNGIDAPDNVMEFELDDLTAESEKDEAGILKTIRCQKLTLIIAVLDKNNNEPIMKVNFKASSWIRHMPREGSSFLFDLKNFEFVDCSTNDMSSKLVMFEVPDADASKGHSFGSGIMAPFTISSNCNDDIFLESFCEQMRDGELAMPPRGVVSRLLLSERPNGRSFSLSAHAATMIWNKKCLDAFMNTFFPSQNLESRSVLQNQLRNAATPIAHRTQVALTSPKSMSIHINIDAPKVWFPISPNEADGALFVDVGKMTLYLKKPEYMANVRWAMECTGMHAKLRRSNVHIFQGRDNCRGSSVDSTKSDIPIILPLTLKYEVERSGDGPAIIKKRNGIEYKQSKISKLAISKICVKLVDVEVVGKAIGKWYATQLHQVKQSQGKDKVLSQGSSISRVTTNQIKQVDEASLNQEFSVHVEKVELFLQGPSNRSSSSTHKHKKRIYLVELEEMNLTRAQSGSIKTSTAILAYIKIALMKDFQPSSKHHSTKTPGERYTILKCCENLESDHSKDKWLNNKGVLGQSSSTKFPTGPLSVSNDERNSRMKKSPSIRGAITFTFIHDEDNLVDDLDVTLNRIEVLVTSTSLRDCYGATKRVLEVIKIMTGEMERRVHTSGRSCRRESLRKIETRF